MDLTGSTQTTEVYDGGLADRHLHELRDNSGIPLEVIAERGYRTVSYPAELSELGFADYQCRAPAILIPLHGGDGSNSRYAVKPDFPRTGKDGKVRKYDYPAGQDPMLDVPRRCLEQLLDPSVPLLFTEGPKKADYAAGRGHCAIDVFGVHNWYRNPEHGGFATIAPLRDWDVIIPTLDGRECLLGFDSDAFSKPGVGLALRRLATFLTRHGALVRVMHLPDAEDGAKQGIDDVGDQVFDECIANAEPWGSSGMVRQLQARIRELEEERSAIFKVLHNEHMTAGERIVAVSVVCQTQSRVSRGHQGPIRVVVDAPKDPSNPNDQERVGLATDIGLSKNTVRRALDHVFADDAPIVKTTKYETNPAGEPRAHIELVPKCSTTTPGMLWQLARLKPAPIEAKPPRQRCLVDLPHVHKCTETCTVTGVVEEREVKLPGAQAEQDFPDTQNGYEGDALSQDHPLTPSVVLNEPKMGIRETATGSCRACGRPWASHAPPYDSVCRVPIGVSS